MRKDNKNRKIFFIKSKAGFAPTLTLSLLHRVSDMRGKIAVFIEKIIRKFVIYPRNKNAMTKSVSGFAVLFAVLLASFLITLGLSIFSISLKEIMIITSVRDSQIAYYAADSARECALYWDVKQAAFPACLNSNCNSENVGSDISTTTTPTVICNGHHILLNFTALPDTLTYYTGSNPVTNFFDYSTTPDDILPVADLRITKQLDGDIIKTTIETWGHNTTVMGRRVERGISQKYNQ